MNLTDYLIKNISNQKEIENTTSFYKKFNDLSVLYEKEQQSNQDNQKILRSQGKYNSKICFIFKNENHFKECMTNLNRILPQYNINIWDILVLFSCKFCDSEHNIDILKQEINIVNPVIIYIFDDDTLGNNIKNDTEEIIIGSKIINVNNIQSLLDNNVSSKIFDLFEYLITYNY